MKNAVARYLLAAMAADAAWMATVDDNQYHSLVTYGRVAVSAERLSDMCDKEGDCSKAVREKIRRFLSRTFFGADEWYDRNLHAALNGKLLVLADHDKRGKEEFDRTYRDRFQTEPPNLGEP